MGKHDRLSAEIPDIFRLGFAAPENSGMTVVWLIGREIRRRGRRGFFWKFFGFML